MIILKFLMVLSWIFSVGSILAIALLIYLGVNYENSLEKTIDRIKGYEKDYFGSIGKLSILFILTVAYLITYYIL